MSPVNIKPTVTYQIMKLLMLLSVRQWKAWVKQLHPIPGIKLVRESEVDQQVTLLEKHPNLGSLRNGGHCSLPNQIQFF